MQTIPINNDVAFRALEKHVESKLAAKGYKQVPRKGSTSWIDPRIKPADASVRFKLCFYPNQIFFGAREDWATASGVSLTSIGSVSETVSPSPVKFQGEYVVNTAAGKRKIDAIIALLP